MVFLLLPLYIAASGIIMSIIGTFFVRVKEGGDPHKALNTGEFISAGLMVVVTYFLIQNLLPESWVFNDITYTSNIWKLKNIIQKMVNLLKHQKTLKISKKYFQKNFIQSKL